VRLHKEAVPQGTHALRQAAAPGQRRFVATAVTAALYRTI